MIWRISKCAFSLSKKRHIWHHRLENRAVSFCPMYHFAPVSPNPSLVLVQPRKTRPFITERLLMGRKETNKLTNKILVVFFLPTLEADY